MKTTRCSLQFLLEVEDGWPPVTAECIPCERTAGRYRIDAPPLFVKGLSVDDVIAAAVDGAGDEGALRVTSWQHVLRSGNTTIWMAALNDADGSMAQAIDELSKLGCHAAMTTQLGMASINVPPAVSMASVDAVLATLDPEKVAVVFPSMRHELEA